MAYITLPPDLPGIRGLMAFRPETAGPLNELVDVLLRGPNSLSPGERELIATYVSSQNDCRYCQTIHGAVAAHHMDVGLAGRVQRQREVFGAVEQARIDTRVGMDEYRAFGAVGRSDEAQAPALLRRGEADLVPAVEDDRERYIAHIVDDFDLAEEVDRVGAGTVR